MSNHNKFDDYDDDKYTTRKKKMKTLRDDNRYGSIFEKRNKLKNIDTTMFDDESDEDDYYDEYDR